MKKLFLSNLLAALCLTGIITASSAQVSPQLSARLSTVFDSVCTKYNIKGASAAVLVPGAGVWKNAYGISVNGVPVTTDMYFGMGSNTKTHIAALLLKMQEQGMLSLDDTIGKWIQGYPNINGQATIRQCLNHSSGIADYFHNGAINDSIFGKPGKIWSREEILELALAPNFQPGGGWSYSNTNYIIAGIVIGKLFNKSPFTALSEQLLIPAGLNSTYNYGEQGSGIIAHPWSNVLTNYELEDMTATPYLDQLFSLATTAGSLITTAEENVNFWHKLTSGQMLSAASLAEMKQSINIGGGQSYGLGIFKFSVNGKQACGHGGTFFGFINESMVDLGSGVSISVLTNQDSISNSVLMGSFVRALHKVTLQMPLTGVEEVSGGPSFTLYPNPASESISIRQGAEQTASAAFFTDVTGKEVLRTELSNTEQAIETGLLLPGLYFVYLSDKNGQIIHTQKVQIAR
jgi:D-alanyl-D-alanine carboxypeptidase